VLEKTAARGRRAVDAGFSLIELLIAVAVTGVLCSAISGGIIVRERFAGDQHSVAQLDRDGEQLDNHVRG
jgi:prepilin-type N-terminal cleavage/methylation domain-containing protein